VRDRLEELNKKLGYLKENYLIVKTESDKKLIERKIEWIIGTIELNESIYEWLSGMECNQIH
jgi:hypothetical protein